MSSDVEPIFDPPGQFTYTTNAHHRLNDEIQILGVRGTVIKTVMWNGAIGTYTIQKITKKRIDEWGD